MSTQQATRTPSARRGLLARPLDALVFLIPLMLFYELASSRQHGQVVASVLLRQFVHYFGDVGLWAPSLVVVAILLATHIASREPWEIHLRQVGFMYVEAVVTAAPLLFLNFLTPRLLLAAGSSSSINRMALGVGAGVYEELVFRLILISLILFVFADLLRLKTSYVALAALLISSVTFSAHHHRPIGPEEFDLTRFVFRAGAGLYLGIIFWFRGYGPAAGCHAAYNVALVSLSSAGGPVSG
jgi:hypothetical protein